MDKLLTFAYNNLKKHGYKVYDNRPMDNVDVPFIEYGIDIPLRNTNPLLATLTVDVWDRRNSTTTVELLTNDIDEGLENLSYSDEYIQVKVKRQGRYKVDDEDPEVKRRQLIYQLRVFYKGGC